MDSPLEPVLAWLDAGEAADYQAGVLLLQQHCRNRSLLNALLKKDSVANREKLSYELLKLFTNGDLGQVSELQNHLAAALRGAVPAPAPVVPPLPEAPAPEAEQVPDAVRGEVDELTQLMSRLHNERCQLSNRLAEGGPSEPDLVKQILSLQDQYNALAQKRRNLVEGGQPTEQPAAPVADEPAGEQAAAPGIDRADLLQQRGNLRSNISKTKGKLTAAKTEEKKSELAQKLAKYEVELTDVELKLKAPQA